MLQQQRTFVLLYSKSYLLQGGTAIPENADMDNYNTPGNYYCIDNTTAATLQNVPFERGFVLKVDYALGTYRQRQTFINYYTQQKAVRAYDGSKWTDYVYFSDDATLNQVSEYTVPKPEDTEDIVFGDTYSIRVKKTGRVVNIQFNVIGSVNTTNKSIMIFTLNEGYRPIMNVLHNYITQNGDVMLLNITPAGEVQIYLVEGKITNSWIIRQCITFPCAA